MRIQASRKWSGTLCACPQIRPVWPPAHVVHAPLARLGEACLAASPEQRPSFHAIVKVLTRIEQRLRSQVWEASQAQAEAQAGKGGVQQAAATAATAGGGNSCDRCNGGEPAAAAAVWGQPSQRHCG